MEGGKPEKIPIFISSYWDYWVRAVNATPLDFVYGGEAKRTEIECEAAERHEGVNLHRIFRTWYWSKEADIKEKLDPGNPPWTKYIEDYLPQMVVYDEAPKDIVKEKRDINRVIRNDKRIENPEDNLNHIRAVISTLGDDFFAVPNGGGIFPHARRCLGGLENTMISLIDNPDLVEAVLDALVEYKSRRMPLLASSGADAVWCGAYNEGAEIINPKLWRGLLYPRHKSIVRVIHENGLKAICWFLGDCMPLLEDLVNAGYDMLVLEQSRTGYTIDLAEIRKRVGSNLCVSGWVPELAMIQDDRETIARCIDEQVNAAGRDGAFLFSTSMLDSNVNPETVDYFCEKVREY